MSKLIMYSLMFCPTCVKAREALDAQGVDYEDRVVDFEPNWQQELIKISKQDTAPVFVHPDGSIEVGWEGERG